MRVFLTHIAAAEVSFKHFSTAFYTYMPPIPYNLFIKKKERLTLVQWFRLL
jgi:hypothetical protein